MSFTCSYLITLCKSSSYTKIWSDVVQEVLAEIRNRVKLGRFPVIFSRKAEFFSQVSIDGKTLRYRLSIDEQNRHLPKRSA